MSFSAQISHDHKLLNVQFNKVACPSGKYFIEVNSQESVIASFEMEKDNHSNWKVTNPVPQWIIDLEAQFAQAITKNNFLTL
jgi:hypothetical protein